MSIYTIHYGFCNNTDAELHFAQLICQTPILKIKTITVSESICIFAALAPKNASVLSLPKDLILIPIPTASKRKTSPCIEVCATHHEALSRKSSKFQELTSEGKQVHIRKCRAYRKEKNRILTEKNWRQHIQRKLAIEAVKTFHQEKKEGHSFFLRSGQLPSPYSLARR